MSNNLTIFKQGNRFKFIGIFTNNYLDSDTVPNILSRLSHESFEVAVDSGAVALPVLMLWHIRAPIGEAQIVAFDDRGFMVVAGEFFEQYNYLAAGLAKMDTPLGMSHGMPAESILIDPDDPRVITYYESEEVSVLPISSAANKLTSFGIGLSKEKSMSISTNKQTWIAENLGDQALADLNAAIDGLKSVAEEAGIESKEVDEALGLAGNVDVIDESAEVIETDLSGVSGAIEDALADVDGDVSVDINIDVAGAASGSDGVEEDVVAEAIGLNKSEMETMLMGFAEDVVKSLAPTMNNIVQSVSDLVERVDGIEGSMQSEIVKAREVAEKEVRHSALASLIGKELPSGVSVIGAKDANIRANSRLAKSAPAEADAGGDYSIASAISSLIGA